MRYRFIRLTSESRVKQPPGETYVTIRWLTVRQISSYLQISVAKVYQMAQNGEIPCSRLGQQWRFDRDEIDRWLRRR